VSAWPDPEFVQGVCEDAVRVARSGGGSGPAVELPAMTPTHVLLLAYMNDEGVGWHRDIYENDGQADHPIVTINLGNACDFVFKDDHTEPKTRLTLHSGDALLFGGPRRHAMHKVSRVHEGTCPEFLRPTLAGVLERARREHPSKTDTEEEEGEPLPFGETVRLSLTFRDAPAVLGREHEFATFKVEEHFNKDENFAWTGGALIGAQQGQEKEPGNEPGGGSGGGSKGQGRRDGGS
jgi:hypothetical protein